MKIRLLIALALAAGAVVTAILWQSHGTGDARGRQPTYAELVAKNYRVLTPRQSRLFVRFARREYRCVSARDSGVLAPVVSPTRITMRAAHRSARQLLRLLVACEPVVGPPPASATLQARSGQILVYVPKWCLLDRKVLPVTTP
jgi:hypothetical protein